METELFMEEASAISRCSEKIFVALLSSTRPAQAIARLYGEVEDKDVFVAGLIGNLIMRHLQWQCMAMYRAGDHARPLNIEEEDNKKNSDAIFMALLSSVSPVDALFRLYDEAKDKDAFVAGLIGCFILRHRQWHSLVFSD